MQKTKIITYWITTALLSFGMLGSGISQLMHNEDIMKIMSPLDYPDYFFSIIGVWKILAVIVILLPGLKLIKEWAYAGLIFVMTGAIFSHLAMGSPASEFVGPIFQCLFISLSWYFRPESRKLKFN